MILIVLLLGLLYACADAQTPGPDGCVSCDDEIRNTLEMLSAVIEGMEPIQRQNLSICKLVEVSGVKTIEHNNKSCIKEDGRAANGKCYYQMLEIIFKEIDVACHIADIEQALKTIAHDSTKAMKNLAEDGANLAKKGLDDVANLGKKVFGNLGKRSIGGDAIVRASWADPRLKLEMKLCFDDDITNITNAEMIDKTFGNLKIWCEGSDILATPCNFIAKSTFVQELMGFFIKQFGMLGINKALKSPKLNDKLSSLNCGPQYDNE